MVLEQIISPNHATGTSASNRDNFSFNSGRDNRVSPLPPSSRQPNQQFQFQPTFSSQFLHAGAVQGFVPSQPQPLLLPPSSSARAIQSTPIIAPQGNLSNVSVSEGRTEGFIKNNKNPRHIEHPTKSVLRSTTFVKEKSSNLTPVPVYLPRAVPSSNNTIDTTTSRRNSGTTTVIPSCSRWNNYNNNSNIACTNFDFPRTGNNFASQSSKFSQDLPLSNFNASTSGRKSISHFIIGSNDRNRVPFDSRSSYSNKNPCQTSVILPSTSIPVTVEIHHPSTVTNFKSQSQFLEPNHLVAQRSNAETEPRPRKKVKTSQDQEMTVNSMTNHGNNSSHQYPIMETKMNIIPNGSAIPVKEFLPSQRSIDLETIDEEGFSSCGPGSRSLFNFGNKMNRQRRISSHIGQEITTISSDIDQGIVEIKVPTLDRRRSSSVVAFENFFKSRRTSMASARASLASRFSFSSDRGHENPNELVVTNFNRMTDLRRMLNQQEEKEDFLTTFWSRFYSCDCFEWNLNNAAKFITLIVLVLTFIMLIRAVVNLINES